MLMLVFVVIIHVINSRFWLGTLLLGWQNWTRPANLTQHDTELIGYRLRLNGFVS